MHIAMNIIEDRLSAIRQRFEQGTQSRALTLEALIAKANEEPEVARREIGEFCHSLAGIAGMLGYRDMGEAASTVDHYARDPVGQIDILLAMAAALAELIHEVASKGGASAD